MKESQTVFSFLHISDLHFASKPYRINFIDKVNCTDFKAIHKNTIQNFTSNSLFYPSTYDYQVLVKSINTMKNIEHDFVLITGDISTTGMQDDLEQAFSIIDHEKLVIIKNTFFTSMSKLGRIFLLPGNHDRYSSDVKPFRESSYSPGGLLFDKIFSKYWKLNNHDPKSKVEINIVRKDDIDIALIRVDFSLEKGERKIKSMLSYAGRGKAYNYILSEIEMKVKEIRDKYGEIPILLANHFHPTQSNAQLELKNSDKFIKKIKKLNIKYLFCGHTHIQNKEELDSIMISCAGSLCGLPGENAFIHHKLKVKKTGTNYFVKIESDFYKRYPNGSIGKYNDA